MLAVDNNANAPTALHAQQTGVRIAVRGVGVVRSHHTILGDVDLTIEPGEVVGIIGVSGAEKSTLLDASWATWT